MQKKIMQLIKLKSFCLLSQHQNLSMPLKKEKGKVVLKNCSFFQIKKLIFYQKKEKIKAFYQPHCIIPNNVMNLHFFGSSYVFKVKSICVKICISRKLLLMQDIKKLTSWKLKKPVSCSCNLILKEASLKLLKIAQYYSF